MGAIDESSLQRAHEDECAGQIADALDGLTDAVGLVLFLTVNSRQENSLQASAFRVMKRSYEHSLCILGRH